MINMDVSEKDQELIGLIAERTVNYAMDMGVTKLEVIMDLVATHANGCPLNLEGLLTSREIDLSHDVFGIMRFLDRETGELDSGFCPRYSK